MYKNKKIIAFVPARKGSKRLPNKNIMEIDGKPLFVHSVELAKKSKYIDDILVSTDSIETLKSAHSLGCLNNNLRPDKLSTDTSRIIDSILYELNHQKNKYDAVVLLQPTFPYRTVELLDSAIEEYFKEEKSLITVVKCNIPPVFMRNIVDGKLVKIIDKTSDVRSQDFIDVYKIIGSIYINNISLLSNKTVLNENQVPFVIDNKYDIDIDEYSDFKKAQEVIEAKK